MRPPAIRTRVLRLFTLLLLGLVLATGAAVAAGTSPAWADPGPTPAPTPAPGVPDPGVPPVPNPTPAPPSPSPSPSPVKPTPSPIPAPDSNNDPGMFDIPGQIRKAINDFIAWIAKTGLKPVLDALGHTVLSTPKLTDNPQVKAIWTTCLITANAIFVLFIIAGGFIITSRETLQSSYGLKEIAPRVVVAGVAANVSLLVCGKAIEAANALTAAIAGQGVDGNSAATALNQILNQPPSPNMPPILFSLLILAALVMAIVVLITFILRTALLVLLIGVAPLALTCHATPQTEGLAHTWWRAFGACLAMQLGQAVIVLATVRVFLTPAGPEALSIPLTNDGLIAILVCLTMLWLLIKLPGWMRHLILGPLARRHGRGLVGQIIHAVIMVKTLGTLAGISRGTSRPARSGQRPGSGSGTGPSPSGPSPSGPTRPTGGPRPPRRPRPGGPRPVPAPAGPAAFSNAPTTHTPMPAPAGTAAAPAFSNASQPAPPRPAATGGAAPARFSHQPAAPTATPARAGRPAPVQFSNAAAPATPRRPAGPVPTAGFSAAPRAQTSPKRPPAPVTPVFSAPARPAAGGGTRAARAGSPPARSVPAVPARPRRVDPPSPRGPALARRAPAPSPPSPPSPPARAPRPAPSPPVPPSPPRRTRPEGKG